MSEEDRAQEVELHAWELNNRRQSSEIVFTPLDSRYGPKFCTSDDCGDEMPEIRRQYGKNLCTYCQNRIEKLHKFR